MPNLVPIGRFSGLTRLSIKALRLYDELGLLRPALVDRSSGYRYYSLAQVTTAARIRLLRSLEMPLEEIRAVLREQDPDGARELLARHERRIAERIEGYQRALALLHKLMETEEEIMAYEIKVKEIAAQPIAGIRMRTTLDELSRVLPRTIDEVFGYLARQGLPPGVPVAIYHEVGDEGVDVEVGVPVDRPIAGDGRVTNGGLPGGSVAYALHIGPYDEFGPVVWPALYAWIQEHGHEPAGPGWEAYLTSPAEVASPAEYRTEALWPIR